MKTLLGMYTADSSGEFVIYTNGPVSGQITKWCAVRTTLRGAGTWQRER
jgi:hypothetical protein